MLLPRASHPCFGVAAALELCDSVTRPDLPIQVVLTSRGMSGQLRTRVETLAMRTSSAPLEVAASLRPSVAAVLVAKQACLMSRHQGAYGVFLCDPAPSVH